MVNQINADSGIRRRSQTLRDLVYLAANSNAGHHTIRGYFSRCPCAKGGGEVQTEPFGTQLHASDYVPIGIPSIMPLNIGDNRIVLDGIARRMEKLMCVGVSPIAP
jgi:hypothetical protein